jgi:protein tyrosine phosphatase (PTP) superfamily phosphohydrolase (DUF442 family)
MLSSYCSLGSCSKARPIRSEGGPGRAASSSLCRITGLLGPGTYWLELVVVLLLAAGNLAGARERGLPPSEGINNFGKVNDRLYRGAQPDAVGIRSLKRLGVKTILSLRQANDVWQAEAAEARADGLVYTNVPMKGFGRPSPEQVAKALALIETLPSPVFVHCKYGCDRAGTIIACYRIQHYQWSSEAALQEAKHYGISMFAWGMKKYIVEFGKASPKP